MLRAIIFDFDGTIAETERFGHLPAYNRAFAESGLSWFWDESLYGELLEVAGGKERLVSYMARFDPPRPKDVPDSVLAERLHLEKARQFRAATTALALRPGILRLVREAAAAGVTLAIATTAARSGVDTVLQSANIMAYFGHNIASGETAEAKKPAPDVYLRALRMIDVSAADAVAIEDSSIGLRAGLAAGIATVVTVSDYTGAQDFAGAASVLSDLGEPAAFARTIAGARPPHGIVDLAFLSSLLSTR